MEAAPIEGRPARPKKCPSLRTLRSHLFMPAERDRVHAARPNRHREAVLPRHEPQHHQPGLNLQHAAIQRVDRRPPGERRAHRPAVPRRRRRASTRCGHLYPTRRRHRDGLAGRLPAWQGHGLASPAGGLTNPPRGAGRRTPGAPVGMIGGRTVSRAPAVRGGCLPGGLALLAQWHDRLEVARATGAPVHPRCRLTTRGEFPWRGSSQCSDFVAGLTLAASPAVEPITEIRAGGFPCRATCCGVSPSEFERDVGPGCHG